MKLNNPIGKEIEQNKQSLLFFIVLAFVFPFSVFGQYATRIKLDSLRKTDQGYVTYVTYLNGDTIPMVNLPAIRIGASRHHVSPQARSKWENLVRKVKKVYPYANLAAAKMREVEAEMALLSKKRDQKKFIKQEEKKLFSQFEKEIKNMTVSEGLILIKLIDRQTGHTSFELVKEFKGSLNAFMWQTVARLFGHNLKTEYDPQNDDKAIEEIVKMIENGDL